MFDPKSRYHDHEQAELKLPDGSVVRYLRRRFLPQGPELPVLTTVTVSEADRLDLLASRTLGGPESFWRICDAANAMRPDELLEEPGRRLVIPLPLPGADR